MRVKRYRITRTGVVWNNSVPNSTLVPLYTVLLVLYSVNSWNGAETRRKTTTRGRAEYIESSGYKFRFERKECLSRFVITRTKNLWYFVITRIKNVWYCCCKTSVELRWSEEAVNRAELRQFLLWYLQSWNYWLSLRVKL